MIKNAWYIAAESQELKNKPLSRKVAGVPLVLFRDLKGVASALFDRCPHRNVKLSQGRVQQGRLQCAYHGWEFDAAGKCVRIPALPEGGHIPKGACTRKVRVIEQQNYLWVWVGERPPGPEEQPYYYPYFNVNHWGWGRLQSYIHNSVANVVENFIDNPHTGYVHGGLFRNPASHWVTNELESTEQGVIVDIHEEKQANSLLARLLVGADEVTHQDAFFYPSTVRVAYAFGAKRQMVGFQTMTPVDELETRIYVHICWQMGPLGPLVRAGLPLFGAIILKQDVDILNSQGQMIREYGEHFTSIEADTANLWIQANRQRIERGEKPKKRKKRVRFRL